MNSIIQGLPLLQKPLSSQIMAHGGQGLAWVDAQPQPNSFSVLYKFKTDEGVKQLLTRNEFQFGFIDDSINHHAYYLGDTGQYVLRSKNVRANPAELPTIDSITLGFSFSEAKKTLQLLFPDRNRWNLEDPVNVLNKIRNDSLELAG
jgi:hypothetical protein